MVVPVHTGCQNSDTGSESCLFEGVVKCLGTQGHGGVGETVLIIRRPQSCRIGN